MTLPELLLLVAKIPTASLLIATKTVDQRFRAATQARQCAETIKGLALAATSFEKRAAIEGILNPLVQRMTIVEEEAESEKKFSRTRVGHRCRVFLRFRRLDR